MPLPTLCTLLLASPVRPRQFPYPANISGALSNIALHRSRSDSRPPDARPPFWASSSCPPHCRSSFPLSTFLPHPLSQAALLPSTRPRPLPRRRPQQIMPTLDARRAQRAHTSAIYHDATRRRVLLTPLCTLETLSRACILPTRTPSDRFPCPVPWRARGTKSCIMPSHRPNLVLASLGSSASQDRPPLFRLSRACFTSKLPKRVPIVHTAQRPGVEILPVA